MSAIAFDMLPATKQDLQIELAPLRADLILIKWILGILLGGVMALMLRGFFLPT